MKSRPLLIGSALALGVLLPLVGFAWLSADPRPAQALPGVGVLKLSGTRYGPTSQLALGPPWKRRLFPLAAYLPGPLVDRIGWEVRDLSSDVPPDSLVIATEAEPAGAEAELRGHLIDSHGCRFVPEGEMPRWSDFGSDLHVECFPFFPRRELGFRLELFRPPDITGEPAATFSIGNPVSTTHPIWTPDALPATRSSGPLTVTLAEAAARDSQGGPGLRLRFRTATAEAGWMPVALTLSDAMGGFFQFEADRQHRQRDTFTAAVGLCRVETYSCKVEFSRAYTPRTRPDRVHDLGAWNLDRLSEAKVALPQDPSAMLVAVPLPGGTWLRLDRGIGGSEVARLIATDAEGRVFESDPPLPESHLSSPGVFIPKGSTRLHVRFGTFQPQTVTFLVKPRFDQPPGE